MNQDEQPEVKETSQNSANEQNGNEEHYNLYTEHIVKDPWEKVKRRMKRAVILLAMAIVFGLIAGLVMIIVNQVGTRLIKENTSSQAQVTTESSTAATSPTTTEPSSVEEETTRDDLSISVDEETTAESEEQTTDPSEEDEELEHLAADYEVLKKIANKVNRYMVNVTVSRETMDWFASTYQNVTSECGVVIANNEAGCYIVTDYELVAAATDISVTFSGGAVKSATILAGDRTTGVAVILTEQMGESDTDVALLSSAQGISQGDFVLAVGKVYGAIGSIGYGIATSTGNYANDTDTNYQLVSTNIAGLDNAIGVITNIKGEVVALITNNYLGVGNNLVTGYSINGIQTLVQNLSNSHETAYLGIRGQNITEEIKNSYDLTDGIYITAVETNSPAYKAGLQSGDILVGMDGEEVLTMSRFMEIMSEHAPGDVIMISIERKGRDRYKTIEFQAVLSVE